MKRAFVWLLPGVLALGMAFPASVLADAPTATGSSPTGLEDQVLTAQLVGDDANGDPLTFSVSTPPTNGNVGAAYNVSCDGQTPSHCTADIDYTPNADYAGLDSFTFVANDGTSDSSAATVDITITGVNDPPTFTDGGDKTVLEDSGAASYPGWASSLSPGGGADESTQTVAFHAGNLSNAALFADPPAVDAAGTLTFTPATDANGSSTVDITAQDDGGVVNCTGACDTSSIHTITITVTAVNDAPSFTSGGDVGVNEDSGAASFSGWATNASAGPSDESTQTLNYIVSSDTNPSLFGTAPAVAANGTLTFTPAANRYGTATVGVKIHDNGGTANGGSDTSGEQTFVITVTNVDDPPNAVNDTGILVPENAPATALNVLANDTYLPDPVETLTIVSVTQGAHGTVAITGGGTGLTYQPSSMFVGQDQFTYTIQDSGGVATDQATVAVDVGKDVTPPNGTAPVESYRTGVAISSTGAQVHLSWSATDAGVGVGKYLLQMSTDGGSYVTITLPTPTTTAINKTLAFGHRYQFRERPYDKNGNAGSLRYGPQFLVSRIEDTSSLSKYSANVWHVTSNTSDSGGAAHYTYAANATATLTLSGRDYAIVVPKNSFRGSAWIYVDGVFNASVTEKTTSSTTSYRIVLWSIHFATSGTHVIQIKTASTSRFDLDAFIALR